MTDLDTNIEPSDLRVRILDAFMARAKEVGVRAVSTDELAKTLSISKKTLYKQFRSKEEIVSGVLDRWEQQIKENLPLLDFESPKEFAVANARRWFEIDSQFSPQFWEDASQDYPALRSKYFDCLLEVARVVSRRLSPYRKPNLPKEFVREAHVLLVFKTVESDFYEKANVSREEAHFMGINVWLDGCFDLPKTFDQIPSDA